MTHPLIILEPDGRKRGADPREMTGEELEAAGIVRIPPMKALRLRLGLTKEQVAKRAGTTASGVQKVEENDRCHTPVGRRVFDVLCATPIKPWREFAHVFVDGDSVEIRLRGELAKGRIAVVDLDDYERVLPYSWHAQRKSWPPGEVVAVAPIEGQLVSLHRYILGACDDAIVDHRNHNSLDCRRSNLRVATSTQNGQNRRKLILASSRYKGVHFATNCGKWRARIVVDKIKVDLGLFADEIAAALAYDMAALCYFGEFAHLNLRSPREMSDEQRAAAGERLARAREARSRQ